MIYDIIFISLVIPMFTTLAVCYHILPRFIHNVNPVPTGLPLYDAVILSCDNGKAVVQFRIEEEKKTVIQTCPTERNYLRGEHIGIYFLEEGFKVYAYLRENRHFDKGYLISFGIGFLAMIIGTGSFIGLIVSA